jgi:hypothetical protein
MAKTDLGGFLLPEQAPKNQVFQVYVQDKNKHMFLKSRINQKEVENLHRKPEKN